MSGLLTSLRVARTLSTSASPLLARPTLLAAAASATSAQQQRGMAKLSLIGNLVATPTEEAAGGDGSAVTNVVSYTVAVNHNLTPGSANPVSFFRVASINPTERRRAALLNVPKG